MQFQGWEWRRGTGTDSRGAIVKKVMGAFGRLPVWCARCRISWGVQFLGLEGLRGARTDFGGAAVKKVVGAFGLPPVLDTRCRWWAASRFPV